MQLLLFSISILLMILLPVGLAVALRRRQHVPWWLFTVGIATFVASQLVHLPLNYGLERLGVLPTLPTGGSTLVVAAITLGLTAGLSEELARAAGYWLVSRARRIEDGVMMGLGHGGIEAMLFGGVLTAATVTALWPLRQADLDSLGLEPAQLAALQQQLSYLAGSPAIAFAPLLERALAIVLHVVLSLIVLQAFRRRQPLYLVAAILYHAAANASLIYAAQQLDNAWLLEGLVLLMVVPGFLWAWRFRGELPSEIAMPRQAIPAELSLLATAMSKELREQWRTKRWLVVTAVFAVFGMTSPLIAYFTPQLLQTIEGAELFADLIPTPTAVDAVDQYVKNLVQFGFLLAILLSMGAVAGEKEKGTAAMILSKPLPRWAFIVSKFAAQALVYLSAFTLAGVGAYLYTLILFEAIPPGGFLLANFLLWLWLLTFVAVTLLGSSLARSIGAAAGIAALASVLLLLAGALPRVGSLAPAGLINWADTLALGATQAANGGALAMSLVIILVSLITAVALFEVQEI